MLLSRLNAPAAITALETAVASKPTSPEAHNMLGLALARVGRTNEAIAQYRTALQLNPDIASARFNLANAEIKAGNLDGAIDNLRQVLAILPNDAQASARLEDALALAAGRFAGQEKWPQAEVCYRDLVKLAPGRPEFRNSLAEVLRHEGRSAEAAGEYRQVLAIDPGNDAARRGLHEIEGR